jgi:hypothetical protein
MSEKIILNTKLGQKGFVSVPLQTRLSQKFIQTDGCWPWSGATTGKENAYGLIWNNGKYNLAHRVMYEIYVGEIPAGFDIDHLCRNKLCVNPMHLEAVSHRENMLRADVGAHNKAKTHCPKGHEYSQTNTRITHGSRSCRMCESIYNKKRWEKYKAKEAINKAEGTTP